MQKFLASFETLKNVDFREIEGLRELNKLQLDQVSFEELAEMKICCFYRKRGLLQEQPEVQLQRLERMVQHRPLL